MSFRLADLKRSVRKSKEGHVVTPARLEGRAPGFRIEFLLQQFEDHLGRPRRMLDPNSLLDFVGDARLGRGLLATLAQWYRMRPRTFAEVLEAWYPGGEWRARLLEHGLAGPVDLRAWLYQAVNRGGKGYLDPEGEAVFWKSQSRALGLRREDLQKLMLLDRPEEAILIRMGPRPTAADVMAIYNARACTTLLRSATEVTLDCGAATGVVERAARAWAGPLDVEWRAEAGTLRLLGRADALGCWTRHGRRVERAALELLTLPGLEVRELRGQIEIGDKNCRFHWKTDTLALLGAGSGTTLDEKLPEQIARLAVALRRERDRSGESAWSIRRPSHLIGVGGGVCLPHLELRRGDSSLYVRLCGPEMAEQTGEILEPFLGKTPLALTAWSGEETDPLALQFAGEEPKRCQVGEVLAALATRLDRPREMEEQRRAMKPAA